MTKKHRFYFIVWKIKVFFLGIRRGTFVSTYSVEKNKYIAGVIDNLAGESITDKEYGFDIYISWLEPLQGYDSRLYNCGSYSLKDFEEKVGLLTKKDMSKLNES